MSNDLRARKLVEVEDLRKQAFAAKGVGHSMRSLAPVVRNELRSIVGMHLAQGVLKEAWAHAQEAAAKSDVSDNEQLLAAVSVLLIKFCDEAGKRVLEHGDILVAEHHKLLGKASGIASMLDELVPTAIVDYEGAPPTDSSAKDEVHA